jgi:hypothetical protein
MPGLWKHTQPETDIPVRVNRFWKFLNNQQFIE